VSKAFVKSSDEDEESPETPAGPAPGGPIYMTRRGWLVLKAELDQLVREERPKLVEVVAWAAGNGDRSENGDYIYGKKRLREIDRRIRFLIKRLENARVVDPAEQRELDQVFFGATVVITEDDGASEQTYQIVGVDEANATQGRISWISPLAKSLLKAREGDMVSVHTPAGTRQIEILEIRYE
jgi:transcription elongation factor GreB